MSEAAAIPFRLPSLRIFALLALWGLFICWTLVGIVDSAGYAIGSPPTGFHALFDTPPTLLFALDLWALLASLMLGLVAFNPFGWRNGKRLILGCMAFAMMLGRLPAVAAIGPLLRLFNQPAASLHPPLEAALVAAPFALLLTGIIAIVSIGLTVFGIFAFLVGIPVLLFNQIFAFESALARFRFQSNSLAGYIARAVYWLRNEPMPQGGPDERLGARYATRAEMMALHNRTQGDPTRMAFGHWPGTKDTPFFVSNNKHVLIMASTRSGKGVALIIPHLLRYQGSAFVLDPKGENAVATGRARAGLNQKVHYLDPFGISGKPQSRFNPLSRFTPQNMEAESRALAAAMFITDGRRDHWTDSGQQLLAAMILYVYCSREIPPQFKDLLSVRKLLLGRLTASLKDMLQMDDGDGLLAALAASFLETPEREFGSIVSTARRQTEILDNPAMIACLAAAGSAPEVDFKDWHRGTMSVFLCLSAPKFPTFNRWLRLVLTSALDEMTDKLDPPALPVCFMLDELATLGHLQSVENAIGLSAGYGIQLVSIFQDVAQMKSLYRMRWSSFVGNAGVRVLFNLDDHETADYWSNFIGGRIMETRGRQEDMYGLSAGQNVGEHVRPFLTPDRLMMDFARDRMLSLVQGTRPIVTDRVPYYEDETLRGRFDNPFKPKPTPPPPSPPPGGTARPSPGGNGPWTGPRGPGARRPSPGPEIRIDLDKLR